MTPRYARAPIGERAIAYRPVNRGQNVSMVGAVGLRGVVALRSFEGAINTEKFLRFLRETLSPRMAKGDVLVMDNLRVHKAPEVLDELAKQGIRVLFLPPYSPEFNPIEMYWSAFKNRLRRVEARSQASLLQAIRAVRRSLEINFAPLFRTCGYFELA